MKNILTTAAILISMADFAQVGINNTSPKATLDITAKTTDGSKPEGLIAPRLTGNQIQSGTYGSGQTGAIIYATAAATAPNAVTANITAPGYYYFDGSAWQKMTSATAGDITNDAWINDATSGLVKLGTKADGTARAAGADFVAKDNGQIGIGTGSPDASAALEVSSTNKGMLIPRVALTGSTDQTTIPSPATGLMAYNTGAAGLAFKGFVFWNGTEWRSVNNNPTISPTITSLKCTDAYLEPNTFTAGIAYTGVLKVPYTGGNAGLFSGGIAINSTVNTGLTATLNSGELESGSGVLSYTVSGTPLQNSPIAASFNLGTTVFGATGCSVAVGDAVGTSVSVKKIIYTSVNANSSYSLKIDDLEFSIFPSVGNGQVWFRFQSTPSFSSNFNSLTKWFYSTNNFLAQTVTITPTAAANSVSGDTSSTTNWIRLGSTGAAFNDFQDLEYDGELIIPGRNTLYRIYATRFAAGSSGTYVLIINKY